MLNYPELVTNWINNQEISETACRVKINPATAEKLALVSNTTTEQLATAIGLAADRLPVWSNTNITDRAKIIRQTAILLEKHKNKVAKIVHLETGKSVKDALAEVNGVIELGYFMAGEGQRYYGYTTTSAMSNRFAYTIRQPVGVCALITSFNTPAANAAWKIFPSLICGNTAIMKPSPDTPYTSIYLAKLMAEADLPTGALSIIQGTSDVGKMLVSDSGIELVSFTGSVKGGRYVAELASKRLARVCLELGGKNPLIICDDADIEEAAYWAILSAFSNAGQRCASGSRIIVFDSIYEKFKEIFISKTEKLSVGSSDKDDLGPIINAYHLDSLNAWVRGAVSQGAVCLTGGKEVRNKGFYMLPTVLENVNPKSFISQEELFGPVTCLYRVDNFEEALTLANDTQYGLTGAIHTSNIHRIQEFTKKYRGGVVSINGPTHGSEPHMPFGGLKNSGNGWREPGTQALDTYSEWKTVYVKHNPSLA